MDGKCLIVAFGNPLMGDDGVGQAILAALREDRTLPDLRLEDGGTDATMLLSFWKGEETVILVDALATGDQPGTVRLLWGQEILALADEQSHVHALSLPACLNWLFLAEPKLLEMNIALVGVEPARVTPREGLTPEVAAAVPEAVAAVKSALKKRPKRSAAAPPGSFTLAAGCSMAFPALNSRRKPEFVAERSVRSQ